MGKIKLIGKENFIWYFVQEERSRGMVNKIGGSKDTLTPKINGQVGLESEGSSNIQDVSVFFSTLPFCWDVSTQLV